MSKTPPFFSLKNPSACCRKLYLYRLCLTRPTIYSNKLEISARFSRPTNRRNYLRKKLTQHRQFHQVRPLQIPVRELCENDDYKLKNVDSSAEQSGDIEKSILDDNCSASGDVEGSESKLRKKQFGGPFLLNELEGWVEQYKKDSEFWGVGTGHIFTVFQDSKGKVENVVVNEDEIMRRSGVDPHLSEDGEAEDLAVVNFKISFAKDLVKEMERGNIIIMKDSSVAKFILPRSKSGVTEAIKGVMLKPSFLPRMSRKDSLVAKFVLPRSKLGITEAIRGVMLKPSLVYLWFGQLRTSLVSVRIVGSIQCWKRLCREGRWKLEKRKRR